MRVWMISALALVLLGCAGGGGDGEQTGRKGWLTDANTGCSIPAIYSHYSTELRWDGPCYDGEAMGKGTLRWTEEDGTEGYYRTCLQAEDPRARCTSGSGY